jgi:hypothetical protein
MADTKVATVPSAAKKTKVVAEKPKKRVSARYVEIV